MKSRRYGKKDFKQMDLDGSRAASTLTWMPVMSLATGISSAVAYYQEHGITDTYTHLSIPERTPT